LIVTEQEVNAALDLLDCLADEVQAEHPDLEDEQEACDLLGARIAQLPAPECLLIMRLFNEQHPTITLYGKTTVVIST
jgi:hypothetical protein